MKLGRWYKMYGVLSRWRHSRGFGIHSPFAYDLLMHTLHERCPYYAYSQIDGWEQPDTGRLKLLLRLVCRLHPASATAQGRNADYLKKTILLADNKIEITETNPHFIAYTTGYDVVVDKALEAYNHGATLFIEDIKPGEEKVEQLMSLLTHGMTFSNRHTLIAAGRKDLPRQHFSLNF